MRIDIHPSSVQNFLDCRYKWYRDNLFNPIYKTGYKAGLGTAIHKASEHYYSNSIKKGQFTEFNSDYIDIGIASFRSNVYDDTPDDVERSIMDTIKIYIDKIPELNNHNLPIAVEKTYSYDLSKRTNKIGRLVGTLDIVGSDYIVDIKTMTKNKNIKSYLLQQAIYALLRQKSNENVTKIYIDKIILGKSVIRECYNLEINNIINYAKFVLNNLIKTIENQDDFLFTGNPSSFLCSEKFCNYFDECNYHCKGY